MIYRSSHQVRFSTHADMEVVDCTVCIQTVDCVCMFFSVGVTHVMRQVVGGEYTFSTHIRH